MNGISSWKMGIKSQLWHHIMSYRSDFTKKSKSEWMKLSEFLVAIYLSVIGDDGCISFLFNVLREKLKLSPQTDDLVKLQMFESAKKNKLVTLHYDDGNPYPADGRHHISITLVVPEIDKD